MLRRPPLSQVAQREPTAFWADNQKAATMIVERTEASMVPRADTMVQQGATSIRKLLGVAIGLFPRDVRNSAYSCMRCSHSGSVLTIGWGLVLDGQ